MSVQEYVEKYMVPQTLETRANSELVFVDWLCGFCNTWISTGAGFYTAIIIWFIILSLCVP